MMSSGISDYTEYPAEALKKRASASHQSID